MDYLYSCIRLRIPGGIWLSINSILFFYQAIFKLVTEEFFFSAIRDFYWICILEQPRSFYQVRNCHRFLIIILCYLKPPGYGVYHSNGF